MSSTLSRLLRWVLATSAKVTVIWVIALSPAYAVQPDEILKDPVLEARARALSTELRCLVCQNQSIDESDAPLARDLRILIREQLLNNKSDAEVMDFVVARYGDYVRLRPPLNAQTLILWGLPFAVLLGAGVFLSARRTRATESVAPLTKDEEARLANLLKAGNSTKKP